MPSKEYDVIVIGIGGIGSATVYQLAKQDLDVLGIERFDIPHAKGSSHGSTRIIRLTQTEHPSYVPLAKSAYENWSELEEITGRDILRTTGSIHASRENGDLTSNAKSSLDANDVEYELLDGSEVNSRYPGYSIPPDHEAIYQPDGGFIDCEQATIAHVEAGHEEGATIHAREGVENWCEVNGRVEVETNKSHYYADSVVFSAGSWTGKLIPSIQSELTPQRRIMAWLQPKRLEQFRTDTFPVFSIDDGNIHAYGFPVHNVPGFKFGMEPSSTNPVDPDTMDREPTADEEANHRKFANEYFPAGAGPTMRLRSCLITQSSDGHFILGPHPSYKNITVATGFSGHGYKFTSLMGEILADFVVSGETEYDVDLHHINRFFK